MNQIELRPTYWASVSGGKDSTYMLFCILKQPEKYPLDGVVYFDLEKDYPFIKEVINEVESICRRIGLTFMRIKPRTSWRELYDKYNYPTRVNRWCNGHYKLDCQRQLDEIMKAQGKRVIYYIGLCADENKRFKFELEDRTKNVWQIYPLAEMGIKESFILEWAKDFEKYNDYYKFCDRCGCIGCPLESMKTSVYNRLYYPEEYFEYMTLAKKTEEKLAGIYGRQISVWSGNPKYNTDYRMKRVEELINDKDQRRI